MKEAISQEAVSDISHSRIPEGNEGNAASSLKSAAMLGLALSVGASGALVSQTKASAAVSVPTNAATTEAFSSGSRVLDPQALASKGSDVSADAATEQTVSLHTVGSGESLWQIAQQHRVGLRELKLANSLPPETSIRVGQVLRVPGTAAAGQRSLVSNAAPAQLVASVAADDQVSGTAGQREGSSTANDLGAQVEVSETMSLSRQAPLPTASSELAAPAASMQVEVADASSLQPTTALAAEPAAEPLNAPVATALALPTAATSTYQIRAGDTLSNIASALGTTSAELIRINGLTNPNVIFAGTILTVPSADSTASGSTNQTLGKRVEASAEAAEQGSASDQLTRLQSTASRPSTARILEKQKGTSAEENASAADEQTDSSDLSVAATEGAESIDPYVADLLEEVEEVRTQPVQTSEAASSIEIDADNNSIAQVARPVSRANGMGGGERVSLSTSPATDADSELLAAAPISPDAYIPAQRSQAGEIVSPDMPLLPAADEYLPDAPAYFNGYIWPTRGTLTSGYGWRWGRMHRGVDVAGPVGTPVVAAAPGVVEQAGWNSGGYGNLVEIRHPDGSMTRYAHNNRLSVRTGQAVSQGQQISEMGSTGYSTGPHLHFEVHTRGGGAVNPVAYLPRR